MSASRCCLHGTGRSAQLPVAPQPEALQGSPLAESTSRTMKYLSAIGSMPARNCLQPPRRAVGDIVAVRALVLAVRAQAAFSQSGCSAWPYAVPESIVLVGLVWTRG